MCVHLCAGMDTGVCVSAYMSKPKNYEIEKYIELLRTTEC